MIHHDDEYLALLRLILDQGHEKGDRTGTGTLSRFGAQLRFDLREGFPLLTTKKLPLRWIAEELFWFLRGSTNEHELREKGVDIWKEWATEEQCARFGRDEGDLGPIYGWQWRRFGAIYRHVGETDAEYYGARDVGAEVEGVDQIANALQMLHDKPDSRRIIVSAWDPAEAPTVAVPPCHMAFQFATHEELMADTQSAVMRRVLSCHMYQRSADVFLGVPFNIASYALLVHMFAHVLDYEVGDLIISFGDVHIYKNHVEQVREQLSREPRPSPTLTIEPFPEGTLEMGLILQALQSIRYEHLTLDGYNPHPKISAPVAV